MKEQTPKQPSNLGHLNKLIGAWTQLDPEDVGETSVGRMTTARRLRRVIGVTAIVAALDGLRDVNGLPRLGVKGGTAMEFRYGFNARTSKDFDGAFRGEISEALKLAGDALEIGWNGFTATFGPVQEITRAKVIPSPVRVDIKLKYKGKAFSTIPFELSAAEGRSMDNPELTPVAIDLAPIQLETPDEVALLPVNYQIAQKLHACTEDVGEPSNDRVRDLADLMMLRALAVEPPYLPEIRLACVEVFEGRAQHPWPPVIKAWEGWDELWPALCEREGIAIDLESGISAVSLLVVEIDSSSHLENKDENKQ